MNQQGSTTILLIDDNSIDVEVNTKLLSKGNQDFQIIAKTSANEGLKFLCTCESPADTPELVLLDIYMPEMDGFSFLEEFEQCPASVVNYVQVVMLSSSRDELDLNRAQAHPLVRDVIKKPLNPQAIDHLLG